jgi:hypothetical protein
MQITITLNADTSVKLEERARAERRRVRDQAAYLIERALAERGATETAREVTHERTNAQ